MHARQTNSKKPYPSLKLLFLALLAFTTNAAAQFQTGVTVWGMLAGGHNFGWAISQLEDINGDGITDIIVGDVDGSAVRVYSGKTGVLIHNFTSAGTQLGYAVADAGDVNGDGKHDIIGGDVATASSGMVRVWSGANGQVIWTFNAVSSNDRFGSAVSSAGDVNGDGRADLLVGAEFVDGAGVDSGRAYIFSGINGNLIRTLEAESAGDRFGGGAATLGDITGDGIPDHIIGAYRAGNPEVGKAYVFSGSNGERLFELLPDAGATNFGQFFVAGPGDVDGDGVPDIYVGDYGGAGKAYVFSGATRAVLHRFAGGAGEGAGPGRGAGDVNNDGYADLIVGYWTSSLAATQGGRATVFSGRDGTQLQTFTHNIANSNFGFDAVGLGDVTSDGKYDFLVSAATVGRVYALSGNTPRPFRINAGLNDAWFDPATPGQGFFINVFPELGSVFLAWFTYDVQRPNGSVTAMLGEPGHRWMTAFGDFEGNTAELAVERSAGGIFDSNSPAPAQSADGTITLEFTGCNSAKLTYDIDSADRQGEITIRRIALDNVPFCERTQK